MWVWLQRMRVWRGRGYNIARRASEDRSVPSERFSASVHVRCEQGKNSDTAMAVLAVAVPTPLACVYSSAQRPYIHPQSSDSPLLQHMREDDGRLRSRNGKYPVPHFSRMRVYTRPFSSPAKKWPYVVKRVPYTSAAHIMLASIAHRDRHHSHTRSAAGYSIMLADDYGARIYIYTRTCITRPRPQIVSPPTNFAEKPFVETAKKVFPLEFPL